MKNKIALISGATSGIGRACVRLMARHHFRLLICGRREERLVELKNEIGAEHVLHYFAFDIRSREAVAQMTMYLKDHNLEPDVLINNAGLAAGLSSLAEGDVDDWEQMIDTNVKGLLYMTRQIAPLMIEKGRGHIINIGSIAGKEVYDKGNVYCGTKHMVDALNKAMRYELSDHGIKVSAIHPGAVNTEFSEVRFKGDTKKAELVYEGFNALSAEDIAEAVLFVLQRPEHVNINDLVIMPKAQPAASKVVRHKGY